MLIEVSKDKYRKHFTNDRSPYISEAFIGVVEKRVERVVRLMSENENSVGLIAGIKDGLLKAPFSAPFAGFHYTHEYLAYNVVNDFLSDLQKYIVENKLKGISITLPPDFYQTNMNAKLINSLLRLGFKLATPDIVNWIDLKTFDGTWVKNSVAQNCRKAINHGLEFSHAKSDEDIKSVYDVILVNRVAQSRNIYMTLEDLKNNIAAFPVDFFQIKDSSGNTVGGSVCYRGHKKIAQGVFVGDNMVNRSLGIMDLLYLRIFEFYRDLDYEIVDLSISTEDGEPNTGLIRFKEIHNCAASLRCTFNWSPE